MQLLSVRRAAAAVACLAYSVAAAAQDPPAAQVFGAGVEQVTLDVVVLDGQRRPVTGLKKEDFTVFDEGRAQEIVSFDVIARPPSDASVPPPPRAPIATNLVPRDDRGRTFVVLFDDLHLSPSSARAAKEAVAAFLEKGVADGDTISLISTGGEAWWTTRLPAGREDLMKILKRLDGRKAVEPAGDRITDYEAVQIHQYRNVTIARRVLDRFERYGVKSRQAMQSEEYKELMQNMMGGAIEPYIENRASEAYLKLRARMDATLTAIDRAVQSLAENRDRKALILVSEGFADDPTSKGSKRVIEGARRVNATLYFIDAQGLRGLNAGYSAEFGARLDERDRMSAVADLSREGEGAAALAEDTGGFAVRDTNDFAAKTAQIGRESQSYYLLGFNPMSVPRDGRYRRIKVTARGKGLTVRARKGYFAPSDGAATTAAPLEKTDPELQHALDAPGFLDSIPLRVAAYVLEDAIAGRVHLAIVAEADVSKVTFQEGAAGVPAAKLDTLVVVAHRESGEFDRSDLSIELARRSATSDGPLWYSFVRDFRVQPGGYQVKLVVRDAATKRIGTVVHEFEVAPSTRLRVSTPILTDTLRDGAAPALLARRTFASGAQLYCRFDVFGASKGSDGVARVKAGHALRRRADGSLIGRTAPNPITPTSIGAMARMVQIPLAGLEAGDYELVLSVEDELTGESQEIREPFSITPAAG